VTVNFCPGRDYAQIEQHWNRQVVARPKTTVQTAMSDLVPASAAAALLRRLHLDPTLELAHLPREARRRLVHALAGWPLPIIGSRGYNYAEVTAGGVDLTEIDAATMESRLCPGLFLVGEILDVDGRIGGFNFQWAWSSAHVAARALARL
jgi:predicted Rossmann fold flavoprotein